MAEFDPLFDISHLSEEEQNRIKRGDLFPAEWSRHRNNTNPWPKPTPPPEQDDTSTPEESSKPTGTRVPDQRASPTAQEEADAALLGFMADNIRAIYDSADFEQKAVLWEANKRAYEAAEERREIRRHREQELAAKVLDELQRIKEP